MLESVFGLSLTSAELVFRPCVFQFQFSFLCLQKLRGLTSALLLTDSAVFHPPLPLLMGITEHFSEMPHYRS